MTSRTPGVAEGRANLIPRAFILAVAAAMVLTVASVATARFTQMSPWGSSAGLDRRPVEVVSLSFADLPGGDIAVFLNGSSEAVAVWDPIKDSFQQGVLRVVKRQRKLAGIEEPIVIRLIAWDVGGLTVTDDATDAEIELAAFGADNLARFARLLPTSGSSDGTETQISSTEKQASNKES